MSTHEQWGLLCVGMLGGIPIGFLVSLIYRDFQDAANRRAEKLSEIDRRLRECEMKDFLKERGLSDVKPTHNSTQVV